MSRSPLTLSFMHLRLGFLVACLLTVLQLQAQPESESNTYDTDAADKEMNAAIKKAKSSFKQFLQVLEKPKSHMHTFSVKMAFPTPDGGQEHMWLTNIKKSKGKLIGKINNDPELTKAVKFGQEVEIVPANISDWFYLSGNKLIGGYTIRVIRSRMSPAEQKEFDKEFGATF